MKQSVGILLIIFSLTIFGFRIAKNISFKQNVTGYLKRAASASTIEMANQELTKAIIFLEKNKLTKGYTSVIWQTPSEDIEYWFQNLKASQSELQKSESSSALEKTNFLITLRQTLLNSGKKTRVRVPMGLSVYPNNMFWGMLMLLGIIAVMASLFLLIPNTDNNQ